MRTGLYAMTLTQGGSVSVLRVGWVKRSPEDPDEYDVVWSTVYRPDATQRLSEVWLKGPKTAPRFEWGPPLPSQAHRIHFQALARLDEKLWERVCPRPPGYET